MMTTDVTKPLCLLIFMLLELQVSTPTSQKSELSFEYSSNGNPTLYITASHGCTPNTTNDLIGIETYTCSEDAYLGIDCIPGVCTEEGGKLCLSIDLIREDELCIKLIAILNGQEIKSSPVNLDNVTFFNRSVVVAESWKQQGNTSTVHMKPIPGLSRYRLKLSGNNKLAQGKKDCSEIVLEGDVGQDKVTFTAHWFQELNPECIYKARFIPVDDCGDGMLEDVLGVEDLYFKNPDLKQDMPVKWKTSEICLTIGLVVMFLLCFAFLMHSYFFYWRKKRPHQISHELSSLKEETQEINNENLPLSRIVLVYSPSLHQEISSFSKQLENLTQIKIEDIYDDTDPDKFSDPNIWLDQRIMDTNTFFILAVSPSSSSYCTKNCPSEEYHNQDGGIFSFLFDDFMKNLDSSDLLTHDYKRLHHVRFKNQGRINQSDVTPGRLYHLPSHLNNLVSNLLDKGN